MSFTRHSPYESTTQDRFMGAVLVISIIIGIYSFSQGGFLGNLTDSRLEARTVLTQSYGIQPGAEIKLSGILVGYVEQVELVAARQVAVVVKLLPKYKALYRTDSTLKVNSSLGLDSVITGTGFEFIPGPSNNPSLVDGANLITLEPQSIGDMLEEWNIKTLAAKAEQIVNDLATITKTLVDNQQQLVDTMHNMSVMTRSTSALIASLPPVIDNINHLVIRIDDTVKNVGDEANGMTEDVKTLLQSSKALTSNLNILMRDMAPAVAEMPSAISQFNRVSRQSAEVLDKVNQHWLLGGASSTQDITSPLRYVGDNSIYTEVTNHDNH